jgi:hypothetical protein
MITVRSKSVNDAASGADALRRITRPMSIVEGYSEKFLEQPVARVGGGTLIKLNECVVPYLPLKAEEIAEWFSFFVDWSGEKAEFKFKGLFEHSRTLFENIEFGDRNGNAYKYLTIKGPGMPEESSGGRLYKMPVHFKQGKKEQDVFGLERDIDALCDWECSNLFLRNGIRTAVPVALIGLKSILTRDGERKTIGQAIEEGDLPATREYNKKQVEFVPYLYLRGFSEIMRVVDARHYGYEIFAQECGLKLHEYAYLWTEEVARNVALMHNLGKAHGYLSGHNLTLDGCIVDLTIVRNGSIREIKKDLRKVLNTIVVVSDLEEVDPFVFFKSYFRNRRNVPARERSMLKEWLVSESVGRMKAEELVNLSRR